MVVNELRTLLNQQGEEKVQLKKQAKEETQMLTSELRNQIDSLAEENANLRARIQEQPEPAPESSSWW